MGESPQVMLGATKADKAIKEAGLNTYTSDKKEGGSSENAAANAGEAD